MTPIIQLPVSELKIALTGLSKVINKRCILPILEMVRISREESGEINLHGTNLDSFATYRLPVVQKGKPVEFLIPIHQLSKAVKTCSNDEKIGVVYEGPKEIYLQTFVNGTGFEDKVQTLSVEEWPAIPEINNPSILLIEEVRRAMDEAWECAGTDDSRLILKSIHLDVSDPKAHYLVAANGQQLYSANSFAFDLKESVTIPTTRFLGWNGWWKEGDAQLIVQPGIKAPEGEKAKSGKEEHPGWLQFKSGQWQLITKQVDDVYPNWKQIVPTDTRTTVQIPPDSLNKMLDLIARMPGDYEPNHPIALKISKTQLFLEGENRGGKGGVSVAIPEAKIFGGNVEISINRHYVEKALQFGLNEIHIVDPSTPVAFISGGKRLLVAPLNPGKEGKPQRATQPEPEPQEQPINQTNETINKRNSMAEKPQPTVTETIATNTLGKIEAIKETLRSVMSQCNDLVTAFKADAKDKKVTEREIESVREKLQAIKSVNI